MTTTFCVSGACILKAGKNVSSDFTGTSADTKWTQLINEAECYINVVTKINYIDNYSSLNADKKLLLQNVCSDICAMYAIQYDMSGYTSRFEAQTMLDVLRDRINEDLKLLWRAQNTDFLSEA